MHRLPDSDDPRHGDGRDQPLRHRALGAAAPTCATAFPDIEGEGAIAYLDWLHDFGAETRASDRPSVRPRSSNGGGTRGRPRQEQRPPRPKPGVNVVGYISSERGVGEVARQMLGALDCVEIAAAPIDTPAEPGKIEKVLRRGRRGPSLRRQPDLRQRRHAARDRRRARAALLLMVAAPPGFGSGRSPNSPTSGWRSFDHLDEVWVATEFIAEALRPLSPIPVQTIRVPVTPLPSRPR